jgi:hypothetical protein
VLAACGVLTTEEQLLQRFFEASRLYDSAALEKVSTVVFHPVTDGIVQDFAVTGVDGTDALRTVTLTAQVRTADGRVTPQTLVATLERRERWVIIAITRPPASRTSPGASSAPPS